jgi:hypothetical protein
MAGATAVVIDRVGEELGLILHGEMSNRSTPRRKGNMRE